VSTREDELSGVLVPRHAQDDKRVAPRMIMNARINIRFLLDIREK